MLVKPEAPRPISAGIQPELDWIPWIASTLKLVKVAAHLGIADVCAVHGERGLNAALAVDGKLLGEVGGAVGVGHGAGGQQKKGAEIAPVQGQLAYRLAGKRFAARCRWLFCRAIATVISPRLETSMLRALHRQQDDRQGVLHIATLGHNGQPVLTGENPVTRNCPSAPVRASDFVLCAASVTIARATGAPAELCTTPSQTTCPCWHWLCPEPASLSRLARSLRKTRFRPIQRTE